MNVENLKRRAQLLADVRLFFAEREVLEVETLVLSPAAPTAPYLDSFETEFRPLAEGETQTWYLHTSPEFAMKRLLAQGSGSIYQVSKVFRNGEQGRHHSPEFTLLEWYRVGLSFEGLMSEVETFLREAAGLPAAIRFSYAEVFKHYLGLDIFTCSDVDLKTVALASISSLSDDFVLDRDGWLELLMSEVVEPQLAQLEQPVFVYDFPASQAQLAKVRQDKQGRAVAARFEVYAGGLELANGYDELLDADVLRQRFEQDNLQRQQIKKPVMPIDEGLLSAMESGLPACTGVALGLDRLLMLILKEKQIEQVQ